MTSSDYQSLANEVIRAGAQARVRCDADRGTIHVRVRGLDPDELEPFAWELLEYVPIGIVLCVGPDYDVQGRPATSR